MDLWATWEVSADPGWDSSASGAFILGLQAMTMAKTQEGKQEQTEPLKLRLTSHMLTLPFHSTGQKSRAGKYISALLVGRIAK